jgi:zinc/manganese transport system substrate-binding protein/manganese/iron transport system substrate-binding protein
MRFFGLLVALLLLAACSGGDDENDSGRLKVVATTTQIGDFAKQVGGDRIDLTVLLKANQDAHDFELSPSQVRRLEDADLVLRHGLGLDSYVDRLTGESKGTIVTVTEGITPLESTEEAGEPDPHVWFSVLNARTMVSTIRDALAADDAPNARFYQDNAARYLASLGELDSQTRTLVAQIPDACRKLVTNHDVLGYYAEAYGLEVIGSVIPGTSSEASASAADIATIVRQIRAEGVPAIFSEASINPDLIRQVGREAGVKVVDDLYGDSLGSSSSDGNTYIKMMQANTKKIVDALKACKD